MRVRGGVGRRLLGLGLVGAVFVVGLAACVADAPPLMGIAIPGDARATVSWDPPLGDKGETLVAYRVTPYIETVAQAPTLFSSTATTQTVTGLTNGVTYTFAVTAIQPTGFESASSDGSNPVTPQETAVAAGGEHTCALPGDGTVRCWGANYMGQLGDGTTVESPTAVAVAGITTAISVTAGLQHTCAGLADGTLRCWGYDGSGRLGDGGPMDGGFSTTPVTVSGITTATSVSAGGEHTCAGLADGTARCWGEGSFGRLGDGATIPGFPGSSADSSTPVTVVGINTATSVVAGSAHSCARLVDGTLRCWGRNSYGQVGNGTFDDRETPATVTGINTATTITAGMEHTCAGLADGTLRCWGWDGFRQLGANRPPDPDIVDWSWTPVTVVGISATATGVAAGGNHTCALLADGTVRCWGGDDFGQLGNGGTIEPSGMSPTPVPVIGIQSATSIAAGTYTTFGFGGHTCARLADATVRCWGANYFGQLGDGTTTESSTPVMVVGL
jgi:alpha-tubulin suppressor-like RCC1 family protein